MKVIQSSLAAQSHSNDQQLLETIPAAYLVVSPQLKIIAATDRYLKITQCEREELLNKLIDRDFVAAKRVPWIGDIRPFLESLHRVRESGKRHRFRVREKQWGPDGLTITSQRSWKATSTPSFDEQGNIQSIFHKLEQADGHCERRLMREFAKRAIAIQEEDRSRIARELHDHMAQYLAAMSLELEVLKGETDPRELQVGIDKIQDLIQHVGDDVHRLTWGLRPAPVDEIGLRRSLVACVEELSTHSSLQFDFHSNLVDEDRFSPCVETICYRFIQEALTYIVKHAHAKSVSVIVTRDESALSVIVEDDGIGFDVDQRDLINLNHDHVGLRGLRERMGLIGGKLRIESNATSGTSLFGRIPLYQSGVV